MSPIVIFEHPTIASLAEFLAKEAAAGEADPSQGTVSGAPEEAQMEVTPAPAGAMTESVGDALPDADLLDAMAKVSDADAEEMLKELASRP